MKSLTELKGQIGGEGTLTGSAHVSVPRKRNSVNPASSKFRQTATISEIELWNSRNSNRGLRRRKMGGVEEETRRVLTLILRSSSTFPLSFVYLRYLFDLRKIHFFFFFFGYPLLLSLYFIFLLLFTFCTSII